MSYRLESASEVVRETVPAALDSLFVAITALGNPTVLTFGLAVLYWVGRRRETATVVSYAFVAYGLVLALKEGLAIPRPPEAVRVIAVEGFGFPSGHAAAGAVVFGGLAVEYGWLDDPRKAGAAAAVAAAVGLSRVVLGVHYLGDVVAGAALGVAVLAGVRAVTGGDPRPGFGLAAVAALPALAVTGLSATALGILGSAVGGVAGATYLDRVPRPASRVEVAVLVVAGVAFVALVDVAGGVTEGVVALAGLDEVVLVAGVLMLPVALAEIGVRDRLASESEAEVG